MGKNEYKGKNSRKMNLNLRELDEFIRCFKKKYRWIHDKQNAIVLHIDTLVLKKPFSRYPSLFCDTVHEWYNGKAS